MTRLLGIDVGERRIGLAVAETDAGSVRPLATIRRADPQRDGLTLARLAQEQRIDEFIVGLPYNADGTEGEQALRTREWAAAIAEYVDRPIVWRDERLTSESAEQRIGPSSRGSRGASGGPPSAAARNSRRARVDREAAANILQAELDARAGIG
jgi:putative Holliday junction resolvase